jgi:hypothetical protein
VYSCYRYTLFSSVQPLPLLSLTPLLPPPFSTAFSTHPHILFLHRCYVLRYCWCSVILFSLPSFPEFLRAVPLLLTCSTSEFVYNHACFCAYVYLLDLPRRRENMQHLSFWAWLSPLNMMSSSYIHLPSNHMSFIIPYGWLKLHYVYIPQFLDPFFSHRASGLFP